MTDPVTLSDLDLTSPQPRALTDPGTVSDLDLLTSPQPRALTDSLDSDSDSDELQSILAETRNNLALVQGELDRRAAGPDATYVSTEKLHLYRGRCVGAADSDATYVSTEELCSLYTCNEDWTLHNVVVLLC